MKKKSSITSKLRNAFIAGIVVLVPIGFTLYLTKFLIGISSKLIPEKINPNTYLHFSIPGLEIILTIIFKILIFASKQVKNCMVYWTDMLNLWQIMLVSSNTNQNQTLPPSPHSPRRPHFFPILPPSFCLASRIYHPARYWTGHIQVVQLVATRYES